jgi:hypothetical protein
MKTHYLRITNRGDNLFQQESNTVYAVNLPVGLRNRGACVIECLYSTAQIVDLALDTTILEVGLRTNINIAGYDTQTSGNNFTAGGYKILAIYDLDNNLRSNGTHDRKLTSHSTKYPFTDMYCSSLPETIQFGLYKIDSIHNSEVVEKLTNNGYVSFTLKIQFLE